MAAPTQNEANMTLIRIDDERIKGHLDRVVRGPVGETLNALFDAEVISDGKRNREKRLKRP